MQFTAVIATALLAFASQALAVTDVTWYAGAGCTGAVVQISLDLAINSCVGGNAKSVGYSVDAGPTLIIYDDGSCSDSFEGVGGSGCATAPDGVDTYMQNRLWTCTKEAHAHAHKVAGSCWGANR
ncbi:hypothetical protein C8R45DRAFT_922090 [Mycena sanguinolenta]|nr:hypothetical protein C8R45DRAFT_922090 [Mycena sanguinolenta]